MRGAGYRDAERWAEKNGGEREQSQDGEVRGKASRAAMQIDCRPQAERESKGERKICAAVQPDVPVCAERWFAQFAIGGPDD